MLLQDIKAGKNLTKEELRKYLASSPEGKDFMDRGDEYIAPKIRRIEDELNELKDALGLGKKGQDKKAE